MSTTTGTDDLAALLRASIEAAQRAANALGASQDRDQPPAESLQDALERWLIEHVEIRCKPSTAKQYRDACKRLVAAVGPIVARDLTGHQLYDALRSMPRGSQSSYFSAWSSAINWLELDIALPARPKSARRRAYFRLEDLPHWRTALDLAAREQWARRPTVDCLRLISIAPFRIGEAVSLRWPEVDLDSRCPAAFLGDSKTGPRMVPLGRLGAAIVDAQPRDSGFVFSRLRSDSTHEHIERNGTSKAMTKILRRYTERTGHRWPEGVCAHSLRHTFASHALVSGESMEVVRRAMGHSTAYMTERYSHVMRSELADVVDRVQEMLATAEPPARARELLALEATADLAGFRTVVAR